MYYMYIYIHMNILIYVTWTDVAAVNDQVLALSTCERAMLELR